MRKELENTNAELTLMKEVNESYRNDNVKY